MPGPRQVYCVNCSGTSVHGWILAAFSGTFRAFKCTRVVELFLACSRCPHDYTRRFAAAGNSPIGCTDLAVTL